MKARQSRGPLVKKILCRFRSRVFLVAFAWPNYVLPIKWNQNYGSASDKNSTDASDPDAVAGWEYLNNPSSKKPFLVASSMSFEARDLTRERPLSSSETALKSGRERVCKCQFRKHRVGVHTATSHQRMQAVLTFRKLAAGRVHAYFDI